MQTIRYYYLRTIGFPYLCYLTLIGVHYLQYKDTYFISNKKIIMNLFSLYFSNSLIRSNVSTKVLDIS